MSHVLSIMKENTDNKMAKTTKCDKERTALWGPKERALNIFWSVRGKIYVQKRVTTGSRNWGILWNMPTGKISLMLKN